MVAIRAAGQVGDLTPVDRSVTACVDIVGVVGIAVVIVVGATVTIVAADDYIVDTVLTGRSGIGGVRVGLLLLPAA